MATIDEAKRILADLGMPPAQQNEISALTLLALADLEPSDPWRSAGAPQLRIHALKEFIADTWGKRYAENTRETFRRQVIHQLEQARIIDRNPTEPDLPTNSPRTHYALTASALAVIRANGSRVYARRLAEFRATHPALVETYAKRRRRALVNVNLPQGLDLELSPGAHNELEAAVVHEFLPRFAPGSTVAYVGDTAKKDAYVDRRLLEKLKVRFSDHDKLPDVMIWSPKNKWLFLVEVVTSHGPVNPKREKELRAVFKGANAGLVFVSAFASKTEFKRRIAEIAWETEVWIRDSPDHLVHFDGERFLGPY